MSILSSFIKKVEDVVEDVVSDSIFTDISASSGYYYISVVAEKTGHVKDFTVCHRSGEESIYVARNPSMINILLNTKKVLRKTLH